MEIDKILTGSNDEMQKLFTESEFVSVRMWNRIGHNKYETTLRIPEEMEKVVSRKRSIASIIKADKDFSIQWEKDIAEK